VKIRSVVFWVVTVCCSLVAGTSVSEELLPASLGLKTANGDKCVSRNFGTHLPDYNTL